MPVLKLRQADVRALPYVGRGAKHQCIYWDKALPCFGLRTYPSGRRVYVCSYRIRRRKRLALLGRADVLTLDQADHANPILGIKWFPERQRRRYITTVEMPDFIRALEAEDNEYARHGLWLLLLLGLRSIELLKAKWADIDWDMGTLFVGLTKNGEPLLAPLSDAAMARLKMIPRIANNPYIICGHKRGRPLTGLGEPLRRVLARASLQNIRVHDIRRTVGSWLAQSGVSLHLIGDVLNHRDLRTTLGYAYFQTQQRREALNGHGGKVLSLAAAHLRVTVPPRALSAEVVLRPAGPRSRHRHYFKRESLHELVWTAPVVEVAKRLGVSDVGLANLCRRAEIPTPGRGYWARVESGSASRTSAAPACAREPTGITENPRHGAATGIENVGGRLSDRN